MQTVRLGVIGCGVIGPTHVQAASASPRIEMLAVADRIRERRERVAAEYAVPRTYAEGSELLADPDIDAVVLAVPAADRAELQFDALRLGKHLLLEKPVAMTAAARGTLALPAGRPRGGRLLLPVSVPRGHAGGARLHRHRRAGHAAAGACAQPERRQPVPHLPAPRAGG